MIIATKARFPLDQFCGFAGSSVVYQSTKMLPSEVFCGTIGVVLVRSRPSSISTSKRSSENGAVAARLLVRDRVAASRSVAELRAEMDVCFSSSFSGSGGDARLSAPESGEGCFPSMTFRYAGGSSKPGFSSGYCSTLFLVTNRINCPSGASRMRSVIITIFQPWGIEKSNNSSCKIARKGRTQQMRFKMLCMELQHKLLLKE